MIGGERGFPASEFQSRTHNAQRLMREEGIDALLLTTEPEFRYFSGFLTRFWESPTRPWFLLVPCVGEPVAVIPEIGAALMRQGWITDIRTWRSPQPTDEGVSMLADAIRECVAPSGLVGVPSGPETLLRMPIADYDRLRELASPIAFIGDSGIMRQLRMVKSEAEIEKIAQACSVAGRAFARVGEIAEAGVPLERVFRRFQMLCLEEGADWVAYLAGGAGADGYGDVISPATPTPLSKGDVLMLDTGLVRDGYFCDFDRNFSIGPASSEAKAAHARLVEATLAGAEAAIPGATASDLYRAMAAIVSPGGDAGDVGRLGHGLGMSLTEWPSLTGDDNTVLEKGMVLTLEPSVEIRPGTMMVHEENIVIREGKAQFLTVPAETELPQL